MDTLVQTRSVVADGIDPPDAVPQVTCLRVEFPATAVVPAAPGAAVCS
ncbi:MAG TPA: hypothetical protein VIQ30_02645 [Pseudonocardia sp.]